MADRGRFMLDEYCNPDVEQRCAVYRKEATHCFSTNNPRWICISDSQENMLNVQKWVYVYRLSRLLCSKKKKKKLSLVYHHQAHMLIAYLLPGWKGRKEYMIKRQRYSRLSQPTSVNKHVFIWSPFLLHFPFLTVAFCISRGRKAFLRLFLVVAFGSFSQISLIMFFNKSSR